LDSTLQSAVDRAVLGRRMSLVMLASVGLSPVSYLLAGMASAPSTLSCCSAWRARW
jgi:hypothetical protein